MWSACRRLGFACAIALVHLGCSRPQRAPQPRQLNVLLITIDTFRADRLGAGVAPGLDRLAESSVRFTSARATVPLTLPSHVTILTGLLPPVHGVRANGLDALSDRHPTIATLLKRAGYQTAAFVGAFVLDRRFGLAQGFDGYDDQVPRDPAATERLEAERPAQVVVDHALAWLNAHVTSPALPAVPAPPGLPAPPGPPGPPAPFFVWIHLYDPHAPYTPPAEFRAKARSAYDGEIAYVDAQVARVVDWMRARALTDRSLIVVAGDHGEGLGDHGERTHGMLLYDSTLRVPLMLAAPGHAPSRRDEAVSLRDVAPTILRAVGVVPPPELEGRDLLATARPGPSLQREGRQPDLYAETEYPRVAGWASLQALTDGRWKTIRAGAVSEVYDLQHDSTETRDLARSEQAVAAAMASTIDRIHATGGAPTDRVVSREAEERLRTLGYVASSTQPLQNPAAANPATRIDAWNAFEDALAAANDHRPEAIAALKKLAFENPEAEVFQTTYARALRDAGQPARALLIYRSAAQRWPSDATLLHDLAVAARDAAAQARGSAADALRREAAGADAAAVALAPTNAMAHNGLGLLAVDENRLHDAIAEFQRATAIDANNASYWANLGNARRGSGDRAGAEQAYRRAIEIDPRTVDAANGLGVLLVEAQRPSEAVAWLERATAAAPDFVEARLNLGIALQQAGQPDRAAQVYRSVLAAPPRYIREREAAAKLLASLGAAR
jgi:arylsulfatase A-like enzyme/tetratricopeptide (TPR) repeat protein